MSEQSKPLRFTKMHGAGNDFIVLDATRDHLELTASQRRRLADRRLGIGADQILVVGQASSQEVDFSYRIFNQDGGEVEQCGNGARAFVRFVHEKGLTTRRSIRVQTLAGVIEPRLEDDVSIRVAMGPPRLRTAEVPFDEQGLIATREGRQDLFTFPAGASEVTVAVLSMGNPHVVQIVADLAHAPVGQIGPELEHHARFAQRVNAGFMQVINRHRIDLRVWERGAGETLSCGTGACAAAVSGILRGRLDSPVQVQTRGGMLRIDWAGEDSQVFLSGPAVTVFEGEIDLASLPGRDGIEDMAMDPSRSLQEQG